jgi:Ca2+-binding RTX toxin-like protein
MNTADNRRARRLGLAVGAAAGVAIGLAAASPSAAAPSASASVANDMLTVRGTNGNDDIALRLAPGNPGILQVVFDGVVDGSFDRATFSKINVFLKNGNDSFAIDQVNGAFADEQVTANGGNGNDTFAGGDGAELFIGGNGKDVVDGNRGNDTAALGSGRDTFRWDPGDGSDTIDGGTGTDTLDFRGANVAENMALSPNGTGSVFTRNVGNIVMTMNRVERLNLVAGGGVDNITINDMSGTGFRRADVDLTSVDANFNPVGGPDGAADVVTVNGTPNADHIRVTAKDGRVDVKGLPTETRLTNTETIDLLQVNGGGGDDDLKVGPGVAALIMVAVNLGTAQL